MDCQDLKSKYIDILYNRLSLFLIGRDPIKEQKFISHIKNKLKIV